jgi:ABC-type nitrate/sulfonate/bicarbonate transport system ATPase subunit
MSSLGASAGFDRPFIGVRPFEYCDHKYFFGRDKELEVLERKLKQNRFVAVVGRSGCGKSSLISAGLPRFRKSPIIGAGLRFARARPLSGNCLSAW